MKITEKDFYTWLDKAQRDGATFEQIMDYIKKQIIKIDMTIPMYINNYVCSKNDNDEVLEKVKYIKESNQFFTYGEIYSIVGYWGNKNDYILLDNQNEKRMTFKHHFEDIETLDDRKNRTAEEVEYWKMLFHNEYESKRRVIDELHDMRIEQLSEMGEAIIKVANEAERYKKALEEINSLTKNSREYQPSYYTINHIARNALEDLHNV